jgi:hypothetical protein
MAALLAAEKADDVARRVTEFGSAGSESVRLEPSAVSQPEDVPQKHEVSD